MKNTEEATRALALIEIATEALDRAYYPDDECEEVRSDALGMARQLARIILAGVQHRRTRLEVVEPTGKQLREHKRAKELLKELEKNKYITSDYDGTPALIPLQRDRLVWDETYEEWLERTQDGPGQSGSTRA